MDTYNMKQCNGTTDGDTCYTTCAIGYKPDSGTYNVSSTCVRGEFTFNVTCIEDTYLITGSIVIVPIIMLSISAVAVVVYKFKVTMNYISC